MQARENADSVSPERRCVFFVQVRHMNPHAALSAMGQQFVQDVPLFVRRQRIQIDEAAIALPVRARTRFLTPVTASCR